MRLLGGDDEKCCLCIDGKQLTYRDLRDEIEIQKNRMIQEMNEWQHKLIFITGETMVFQLATFLAAAQLGAVPVLLHPDIPDDVARQLAKREGTEALISRDGTITGCEAKTEDRQAGLFGVLSSGTTGFPKILFRRWSSWMDFFPLQNRIFGISEKSRAYFHGSLSFTGSLNFCLSVLYAGGTLLTTKSLHPEVMGRMITDFEADAVYLVPSKLEFLVRKQTSFPRVKQIITGSQLITARLADRLKYACPNAEMTLYYGTSEFSYLTYLKSPFDNQNIGNVGYPFPGVSITCRDGRIFADTPYAAEGFDGPAATGDSGRIDDCGRLVFNGREDDVLNIGGIKVNLNYVEQVISSLEQIKECAVLADDGGKRMKFSAYVVLQDVSPDVTGRNLSAILEKKLLPSEVPARILIVAELPRNGSGKWDRTAIKKLHPIDI